MAICNHNATSEEDSAHLVCIEDAAVDITAVRIALHTQLERIGESARDIFPANRDCTLTRRAARQLRVRVRVQTKAVGSATAQRALRSQLYRTERLAQPFFNLWSHSLQQEFKHVPRP